LNDQDDPLVGRSLEKGETIHVGSLVRFNSHIAKVQDCVFSPWPPKEPMPLRWNALCSSFVKGDWSSQHPATLLMPPLAKDWFFLIVMELSLMHVFARRRTH
jgi:hypothetical protein